MFLEDPKAFLDPIEFYFILAFLFFFFHNHLKIAASDHPYIFYNYFYLVGIQLDVETDVYIFF